MVAEHKVGACLFEFKGNFFVKCELTLYVFLVDVELFDFDLISE